MLTKYYVAPNGANTGFHAVKAFSASLPDQYMTVNVHSFDTQDALVDGQSPKWAQPVVIPLSAVGAELVASIEEWLATSPDSPLRGATVVPILEADLATAKVKQWAIVKSARDAAVQAGFAWDGHSFDSDLQAQIFIEGATQLALLARLGSQEFSIDFTLQDNTVATLSGDDMLAVGQALGAHVVTLHTAARALRVAIEAATTVEAVAAVVWTG